jgi:hypothetical protein
MEESTAMTEPLNQSQLDEMLLLFKGNTLVLKYALDLLYIGHLWDDLIDKDRVRTDPEINKAFRAMLGELAINPFYQANQHLLAPLQHSAAILWEDSVKLEKGDDNDKMAAFIMRNALASILHYCLFLVGGEEWVQEHGARLWQLFNLNDKWQEFKQE